MYYCLAAREVGDLSQFSTSWVQKTRANLTEDDD
jgi:hypothetical protein